MLPNKLCLFLCGATVDSLTDYRAEVAQGAFFGTLNVLGVRHCSQLSSSPRGSQPWGTWHIFGIKSRLRVRRNVTSFNQTAALRPGWGWGKWVRVTHISYAHLGVLMSSGL